MCAPPGGEFAERLAGVGVPLVTGGHSVRDGDRGDAAPAALPGRAAELVAAQFGTLTAAAEGCDALVAASPKDFAARSVTEKLGIRYVCASYQPTTLRRRTTRRAGHSRRR